MLSISCYRSVPLVLLFLGISLSNTSVRAGEFEEVYEFLQEHALNRTLSRQTEATLAGGTVAYEFRRDMTICNLVRTENRFSYDLIVTIKQRNWDVEDGEKTGDPRVEDRMLVLRFEFGRRLSTGEVVGYSHCITTTRTGWGGSTDTLRMKSENGELLVEAKTGVYDDFFAAAGEFYPGATVDQQRWFVRDGKLVLESRMNVYRVDPTTSARELVKGRDTLKVDTEIAKLPLE